MASILIVLAAAAFVASQFYRLLWHRRYLPPPGPASGIVRMTGHLLGTEPQQARDTIWPLPAASHPAQLTLELERGGRQQVRIDEDTPLFGTRRLRVGDRLTIDAVQISIFADEALYRQQARVEGLDAIRVMLGAWPRLRGLGASCAAALLLTLVGGLASESGSQGWLVRKTAQKTVCFRGTAREAVLGPQLLQRCVDRQGRRHGAYTIWDWSGTLRERGQYSRGRKHGVRDVLNADGSMLRSTFRHGERHGPTILLGPHGRATRHTSFADGVKHGVERLWHDNGQRAFIGYHAHGLPAGAWRMWSLAGRKVAEATMVLGEERWTFFDRAFGSCPGDRDVADRWLTQLRGDATTPPAETCQIRCLPTIDPTSENVSRAVCSGSTRGVVVSVNVTR